MSRSMRWLVRTLLFATLAIVLLAGCQMIQPVAETPEPAAEPITGISADPTEGIAEAFDVVYAAVHRQGIRLIFQMVVAGEVGSVTPTATGQLAGAAVESYVWPTSLNSAAAGFEADQGILALAVTAHPDFDDTPLVDEDQDGDKSNDGYLWHSHWVVLVADDACGAGALKVQDIPEGEQPILPPTWPELPLLIDSPDYDLMLEEDTIEVYVPLDRLVGNHTFNYDGVTAGLRVNGDLHAPLLCVTMVHDVASGDLSLPGAVE